MKLTSIWTMRGMTLAERLRRTRECGWRSLAHHLPRTLAYWSYIDTGARMMNKPGDVVPDVRYMDLLERLGQR
jgi:hypothetical protein